MVMFFWPLVGGTTCWRPLVGGVSCPPGTFEDRWFDQFLPQLGKGYIVAPRKITNVPQMHLFKASLWNSNRTKLTKLMYIYIYLYLNKYIYRKLVIPVPTGEIFHCHGAYHRRRRPKASRPVPRVDGSGTRYIGAMPDPSLSLQLRTLIFDREYCC